MEVATIITSSEETCLLFDKFIYTYPSLSLLSKDNDTAYFNSIHNKKDRLFYHYQLVDPEKEFSYNYTAKDVKQIRNFYGDNTMLMFDLSYRPEELLVGILKAFKIYLQKHNDRLLADVLISHPFDGIQILEKQY